MNRRILALAGLAALAGGAAAAEPTLQLSEHDRFSRAEWDFLRRPAARLEQDGDTLRLHLPGSGRIPGTDQHLAAIAAVTGGQDGATLRIVPGALVHLSRIGGRVIVDVWPPAIAHPPLLHGELALLPAPAGAAGPAQPGPGQPAPGRESTAQAQAPKPAPAVAQASPPPAHTQPAQAGAPGPAAAGHPQAPAPPEAAPTTDDRPRPGRAGPTPSPLSPGVHRLADAAAILIPVPVGVAAAGLVRGQEALIVLDQPQALDLSSLAGDPVFGTARAEKLPAATLLRFPLPAAAALSLQRTGAGWRVGTEKPATPCTQVSPQTANGESRFPAIPSGRSAVIADPVTGGDLLIGTVREGRACTATARITPFHTVLPTVLGLALLAQADRADLRPTRDGFVLAASRPPALPLTPTAAAEPAIEAAGALTRRLDLPALPRDALLRLVQSEVGEAAARPRRERFAPRLAAAQAMLALGLDREAQALATLAAADEPGAAAGPARLVAAVAASLAGRETDAAAIEDDAHGASDEVMLWRAVHRGASPATADAFAATWPLAASYPDALRDRVLPLAAEALAAAGRRPALDRLLAAAGAAPHLDFARALAAEQANDVPAALALFDRLRNGTDRLDAFRAGREAAELRLRTHRATLAQTVASLERLLLLWRGDARELDLRLRLAELRLDAGRARDAFSLLQDTEALFPDQLARIRTAEAGLLASLAGDAGTHLAPLELASVLEQAAPLLADPGTARALAPRLADALLALDLPERALPLLARLRDASQDPATRAALSQRMASLQLERGDAPAALATLSGSEAPNLPPPLDAGRRMVRARALAATHDLAGAMAALDPLAGNDALALRAELLSSAGDWRGAEAALATLAGRTVPASGRVPGPGADLLVRWAAAAEQAGDRATLARLAASYASRLPEGSGAAAFRLLVAAPLQGSADLPRVGAELALARQLPGAATP